MIKRIENELAPLFNLWQDKELIMLIRDHTAAMREAGVLDLQLGLQQVLEELQGLKKYLGKREYGRFVEVGSDFMGTLWLYSHLFCSSNAEVIAIDYNDHDYQKKIIQIMRNRGMNVRHINHSSADVKEPITDIGLLHIDGAHSIDGVFKDWNRWAPEVREEGLILLHDTITYAPACDGCFGMRRYLTARGVPTVTFAGEVTISNTTYISAGITVVEKKDITNANGECIIFDLLEVHKQGPWPKGLGK